MSKIYKGYELLKAMADGEIKEGTKIKIIGRFAGDLEGSYFIYNEDACEYSIYTPQDKIYEDLTVNDILDYKFELIEDEINIEEYEFPAYVGKLNPIENKLIELINENRRAIKQIDKKIKEK